MDQGMSDFYVVFTMIPFGPNFCVWYVMKLIFTSKLQMTSSTLYLWFETNMSSDGRVINVSHNLIWQRLMVKAIQKCDRCWSAIFCAIVYSLDTVSTLTPTSNLTENYRFRWNYIIYCIQLMVTWLVEIPSLTLESTKIPVILNQAIDVTLI